MSQEHNSKQDNSIRKSKSRRKCLSINSVDPDTGKYYEVMLSYERLHKVCSRSIGQTKEAKFLVPEILQKPKAKFEGLRKDEDERYTKTEGWRCYCGVPSCAYTRNGNRIETRPNEVFLVFVNVEKIVYLWYWYSSDENDPELSEDWETRFKQRRL